MKSNKRQDMIANHYNCVAEQYKHAKQFPERIVGRIPHKENIRVLDIGCGTGNLTFDINRAYPTAEIVGVDISDDELRIAEETKVETGIDCVTFTKASALDLPFQENAFDVVTSNMVFHLLDDQKLALSEALRVLKPSGTAILQFQGPREPAKEYFDVLRESWKAVLGNEPFPKLYFLPSIEQIDVWMNELKVERFEVDWKGNTVYLDEAKLAAFRKNFENVSGYWRYGLSQGDLVGIENDLETRIHEYFNRTRVFKLTGSVVLLEMIKSTQKE